MNKNEAIENLQYFVAGFFDGSIQRCFELDQLLWEVRSAAHDEICARKHLPNHVETVIRKPNLKDVSDLLADIGL